MSFVEKMDSLQKCTKKGQEAMVINCNKVHSNRLK